MATTTLGGSVLAANDVQIPPIRTNLTDPVMTNQTAKEWYFFWHQSGDRINIFNRMIAYGNHDQRLDPSLAPDGALYVESDRGDVLYEKHQDAQGNAWWQYVAGTMWGTLSPDQRPADLGVHDAGFDYRTTDTDPRYGGREFIWSGTAWVEVTPNRYGTHADRLALTPANLWQGMIYVETDRSGVIYQIQNDVWHYLAGIMYGLLSTAPNDLGANDAGFQFRATDTGANSGRILVWSGSIWVETTPNRWGTHATRLALPLANAWNGMLWVETDRGNVVYQNQGGTWYYSAGTMSGTLSPDQRPTDLGANDAGFQFRATDQERQFYWNGTAWVETAAANSLQWVAASSPLTLTTAMADIPGLALTLARTGTYQVSGVIDFNTFDSQALLLAQLVVNGAAQGILAIYDAFNVPSRATVAQQWMIVTSSANTPIKLQANKNSGTGASLAHVHSTLAATWISP